MCDLFSAALATSVVVGGASATAGYVGQSQAARRNQRYANDRYNEVSRSAMESYRFTVNQLTLRQSQEEEAAIQQGTSNAIQGRRAQSSVIAGAGGAGVSGNSVDALLDEFNFIESTNASTINRNLRWKNAEIDSQKFAAGTNAQSQINSATPQQFQNPSALALMLQLGAIGTQGLLDYSRYQPNRGQAAV